MSKAVNTVPTTPAVPDLLKARAELLAAQKAFTKIDKQHKRARARLDVSQQLFDKAVVGVRSDAPAGTTWGGKIAVFHGMDLGRSDDAFSVSSLLKRE